MYLYIWAYIICNILYNMHPIQHTCLNRDIRRFNDVLNTSKKRLMSQFWTCVLYRIYYTFFKYYYMFIVFFLDFKSHFRIRRETFEVLVQHIGPYLLQQDNWPTVPSEKQIATALRIFGNQEVYRLQ